LASLKTLLSGFSMHPSFVAMNILLDFSKINCSCCLLIKIYISIFFFFISNQDIIKSIKHLLIHNKYIRETHS
jgi:hypothetical protein